MVKPPTLTAEGHGFNLPSALHGILLSFVEVFPKRERIAFAIEVRCPERLSACRGKISIDVRQFCHRSVHMSEMLLLWVRGLP